MDRYRIRADSFVLKSRRIRIYRVRHRNSGTVLWTSPDQALNYLRNIQAKKLQANKKGR